MTMPRPLLETPCETSLTILNVAWSLELAERMATACIALDFATRGMNAQRVTIRYVT